MTLPEAVLEYYRDWFLEDLLFDGAVREKGATAEVADDREVNDVDRLSGIYEHHDDTRTAFGRWDPEYTAIDLTEADNPLQTLLEAAHQSWGWTMPVWERLAGFVCIGQSQQGYKYLAFPKEDGPSDIVAWHPDTSAPTAPVEYVPFARGVATLAYLNRLYVDAIERNATPEQLAGAVEMIGQNVARMNDYRMLFDYAGRAPELTRLDVDEHLAHRLRRTQWLAELLATTTPDDVYGISSNEDPDCHRDWTTYDLGEEPDALYVIWRAWWLGRDEEVAAIEAEIGDATPLVESSLALIRHVSDGQTAVAGFDDILEVRREFIENDAGQPTGPADWVEKQTRAVRTAASARGLSAEGPLRDEITSVADGVWLSRTSDYPFLYVRGDADTVDALGERRDPHALWLRGHADLLSVGREQLPQIAELDQIRVGMEAPRRAVPRRGGRRGSGDLRAWFSARRQLRGGCEHRQVSARISPR